MRLRTSVTTAVLTVCLGLLLSACNVADVGELAERRSTDLLLTGSAAVGSEWTAIAPRVWQRRTDHEDGGRTVEMRGEGPEAMQWIVANVWEPALRELRESSGDGVSLFGSPQMDRFVELQLAHRIEVSEALRWDDHVDPGSASRSCSAFASATARPLWTATGAEAFSSARTCDAGGTSFASASAEPPSSTMEHWAPSGMTASASESATGTPCGSAALAQGAPYLRDVWYHCP